MYRRALGPLLFLLPPDAAHALALAALGPFEHVAGLRALLRSATATARDERLAVRRMGLVFPSPIGLAGGFDKNGRRVRALAALGFGHIEVGTVTAQAQEANPRPNLFRLPADHALVNRLGFPNDGAAHVAERVRAAREGLDVPVGVSIGKSRSVPADDLDAVISDYEASFDVVRPVADFVVVNVSSPNTPGLRSMQGAEPARRLLSTLRARDSQARILVKIAPDLETGDLDAVLAVAANVGLAGVVATNTTLARTGLQTAPARVAAIGAGGLSGAPLRPRALEVVRLARSRLGPDAVIIGVGGIQTADHVNEFLQAGADLVQMYTGFVYEGPAAPYRMAKRLMLGAQAQR